MSDQTLHGEEPTVSASSAGETESRLSRFASAFVLGIARHWLALFNIAWGMYVFLPLLAPILMQMGLVLPARGIYGVYSFLCHQMPDHSYFLFGSNPVPDVHQLEAAGMEPGLNILGQRRFIGNSVAGYKTALCQRDIAIYGSVLAAGLVYGLFRKRIKSPSIKLYILLALPMAIDGLTQLFGLRESTWLWRSVTGALFAVGSVWLAYPYIDDAMQDVVVSEESRTAGTPAHESSRKAPPSS